MEEILFHNLLNACQKVSTFHEKKKKKKEKKKKKKKKKKMVEHIFFMIFVDFPTENEK